MSYCLLTSTANAQDASADRWSHDRGRYRQQVFISPAGEAFRAAREEAYPITLWFAQADRNHDGRVDQAEFVADFMRFFAVLDSAHAGRLSGAEITKYETEIVPEVASRSFAPENDRRTGGHDGDSGTASAHGGRGGSGRGGGGGGGGDGGGRHGHRQESAQSDERGSGGEQSYDLANMGAARFSLIALPEPVTAMDANLDGIVTIDECRAAAIRRFVLLDSKSRGFLTLADLPKTPAQSRFNRNDGRGRGSWPHQRESGESTDRPQALPEAD